MKHTLYVITGILVVALAVLGCSDKDTSTLEPATADDEPLVFGDQYGPGVGFHAFREGNQALDAVVLDNSQASLGSTSLKVIVPEVVGGALPWFAGGAFVNQWARDLTGYNALTFWVKADQSVTMDVVGIANDNTGTSKYEASIGGFPVTTTWRKIIIPIPLPEKLWAEAGLFWFAENENDMGYEFWLDEIKFENISGISNPRPSMPSGTPTTFVGATLKVEGTQVVFDVNGEDVTVSHLPDYFTFSSSNESVVQITSGVPRVIGVGSATLTAKMGEMDVAGAVTVDPIAAPGVAAPVPTVGAANAISIFSNAYSDVPVDRFTTDWDEAEVVDIRVVGDDVKAYAEKAGAGAEFFLGIDFASNLIDASGMTHFHIDVWVPGGAQYVKVKLVDFGPNREFGGTPDDDSEKELFYHAGTVPAFAPDTWVSLDLPLADFKVDPGLTSTAQMAQLIISTDGDVAFLDNIYFHK